MDAKTKECFYCEYFCFDEDEGIHPQLQKSGNGEKQLEQEVQDVTKGAKNFRH